MGLRTIISGAQTGADRGGLDAALALGIPHGGWCPQGRRAEDGAVPDRYAVRESPSPDYADRTRRNVRDADGTVAFTTAGRLTGGTKLTVEYAQRVDKPLLHLVLVPGAPVDEAACTVFRRWLVTHRIEVLNVAGSRESQAPGLAQSVRAFLTHALTAHDS